MLIFLHGPDSYRSRQKLNEIIEQYKKSNKSGLSLKFFDADNADFGDFKNELETVSLFREKKLIVLKNILENVQFTGALLDYKKKLAEDEEDVIVFFEEEITGGRNKKRFSKEELKTDNKNPFLKFLKENAKSQEFKLLTGAALAKWIKEEADKYGFKIGADALNKLAIYCANNSWRLANEIQKLAAYKLKSKNKEILAEDIEKMVKTEIETDIFKTIDAIAAKNKAGAISLLKEHLEKGEAPLYLLSMINYQFRNLLAVKDLIERGLQYQLIAKKAGLHPFVASKSYELCKKFDFAKLKKTYQRIFEADLQIKTGQIDPETALDLLVAEI